MMRFFPLHIKTTLLASAVILAVMALTLGVFSSRILARLQAEQKQLAVLQAENLAEQISSLPPPRDYEQIADYVALFKDKKKDDSEKKEIRIWERSGNIFGRRVAGSEADNQPIELPDEIKYALRSGQEVQTSQTVNNEYVFSVYVPVTEPVFLPAFGKEQMRVSGAVEISQRLDTTSELVWRFMYSEIGLAIGSVLLMSVAIYFLFRSFVYRPLDCLALAMQKAKAGELNTRVEINSNDELGEIGAEFNRMLAQIAEMTREREARQILLREKVREATAELQTKNAALEEASRQLWQTSRKINELERLAAAGTTAAQFAHEVGTPLNLISGHVQLLKMQSAGDASAENRLQIITAQIERIEKIVRQMLDRTRFGEIEFEDLNLNAVLQKITAVTAPTLAEKNVCLETDFAADLPFIKGNADRLQQVFINLINNALDAMPSGGELKIATASKDNFVQVEVADNGIGMSEETKARIFEPLYTTKQRGHGTGLGLVVVREILREHNAEICVESKPQKGTKFTMFFPRNQTSKY
jgi:two-component system NtrC family sensor kinase